MTTPAEIEAAAQTLPPEDKQQLLLFLAASLRTTGQLPTPGQFSREQLQAWIAEDESGAFMTKERTAGRLTQL
jgi:hypothetical protein